MSNLSNNNEIFGGRHVHPNIVCKTCVWSHGPAPFADDPEKSNCLKYPVDGEYGDKPNSVYFDGEDCEYHMTKAEQEAALKMIEEKWKELIEKEKEEGSR